MSLFPDIPHCLELGNVTFGGEARPIARVAVTPHRIKVQPGFSLEDALLVALLAGVRTRTNTPVSTVVRDSGVWNTAMEQAKGLRHPIAHYRAGALTHMPTGMPIPTDQPTLAVVYDSPRDRIIIGDHIVTLAEVDAPSYTLARADAILPPRPSKKTSTENTFVALAIGALEASLHIHTQPTHEIMAGVGALHTWAQAPESEPGLPSTAFFHIGMLRQIATSLENHWMIHPNRIRQPTTRLLSPAAQNIVMAWKNCPTVQAARQAAPLVDWTRWRDALLHGPKTHHERIALEQATREARALLAAAP